MEGRGRFWRGVFHLHPLAQMKNRKGRLLEEDLEVGGYSTWGCREEGGRNIVAFYTRSSVDT